MEAKNRGPLVRSNARHTHIRKGGKDSICPELTLDSTLLTEDARHCISVRCPLVYVVAATQDT